MGKQKGIDERSRLVLNGISEICLSEGYNADVVRILFSMFLYIQERGLRGACHAACAALYVALSETGHYPTLCVGEVEGDDLLFDHSWIVLDGKIIDIAICKTLDENVKANPIVFGKDVITKESPAFRYGVVRSGLDFDAIVATMGSFSDYMTAFPYEKNGLWDVVGVLLDDHFDKETIEYLKEHYANAEWEYVKLDG